MPSVKENLQTAFAGESQARNMYMAFAKKAEEEGFPQVARLFRAAAHAEYIHAQNHFRALGGVQSTAENLKAAISGENYEATTMYPPFVDNAVTANDKRAQNTFRYALEVEKVHELLYRKALESLSQPGEAFDYYVCAVCGYTHEHGAPDSCPVCGASASKFEKTS